MENELIKVKDYKDLARDSYSRAVVNTNMSAYEAAVKRSRAAQEQKDALRDAVRDINTLKSEIHEIKNLLIKLMEK
jgi:hypothetical protein